MSTPKRSTAGEQPPPPNVGEPTSEAIKGACRAWAQILRDEHPGVSWNVRPVERSEQEPSV